MSGSRRRSSLRDLALAMILTAVMLNACRRSTDITPLTCPPGATLMGAPPPKGEEVWCQKTVNGKPVKDGIFIAWGDGPDKLIQGSYQDGVQEGEWTTWYASGQRSAVDQFHNGQQDGLHTSWYINGVKAVEGNYQMGRREGVWTRWDPTGFTSKQEVYKDDKRVR
jgi:hypothetical protein